MMRMRKKLLAIFLAVLLALGCFALTACAETPNNDNPGDVNGPENPNKPSQPENPSSPKTADEVITELLGDEFMGTSYKDNAENPRYADEWEAISAKKQPLDVGDEYVETFESSFASARLYPEQTVNGATVEFADASVGGIGESGKNLVITTDGTANGSYDSVLFRGLQITPGARYRLTLTAKTNTAGCNYYVGFRGASDLYAFNFSGTEGQVQTVSGIVTLQKNEYTGVVLMIAGNNAPASELVVDNLKIERVAPLPTVELTNVGDKCTIDFEESTDYVSANNSSIERTAQDAINGYSLIIRKTGDWQGLDFTDMKFAPGGTYRIKFNCKLVSGSVGMGFATMSSASSGSYGDVAAGLSLTTEVTEFNEVYQLNKSGYENKTDYFFNFSVSSSNCVFMIDDVTIECIDPDTLIDHSVDLTEIGAVYAEDFDDAESVEALVNWKNNSSTIELVDHDGGKALQVTKVGAWSGLNSKELIFAAKGSYRISFYIKLVSGSAGTAYATMSMGWSPFDIGKSIEVVSAGKSYSFDYRLEDSAEYYLDFAISSDSCVFIVDNIRIECIEPDAAPASIDMTAANASYTQNFDGVTLETVSGYFVPKAAELALVDSDGGKALQVTKTGQWVGVEMNMNFAASGSYTVSFDIRPTKKHDWDTDNFFVSFEATGAETKSKNIGTQLTEGNTVSVTVTLQLDDSANYKLVISNGGGDSVYIIDNFSVTRTA